MAITLADFNKIWASTSPLTPYSFSESNYKQGWNFIGSTPPARQMWDFLQKQNDEKMQYIVNDICVPTEIDETSASGDYYSYPVPNEKVFANFKTLGGKTIAWNQLADPTLTYTTTSDVNYNIVTGISFIAGHKYIIGRYQSTTITSYERNCAAYNDGSNHYDPTIYQQVNLSEGRYWWIFTAVNSTNGNGTVFLWQQGLSSAVTMRDFIFCDLTLMFGAGNEPTTGEQFEALFPANNYPINAGTLLSAGIKEVIAKDSSNNVVATMPIPSAVQSLEGYGWSAGSVYNYIDFTRKKFVKRVGSVDLGTLTYTYETTAGGVSRFQTNLNGIKGSGSNSTKANTTCERYIAQSWENITNVANIGIAVLASGTVFAIHDPTYANANDFKTAMSGVMLYYELVTPVETDISSILGAVGIACGNTLTFNYDDNYKLPVPVSMDLIDNTYGMMTAQDKAKLDVVYDYIQRVSGN